MMSKLSADAFGIEPEDEISCIGSNRATFASCVLSLHNNESEWEKMQRNGISFIERTHSREKVSAIWSKVIEQALSKYNKMKALETIPLAGGGRHQRIISHPIFSTELWAPTKPCREGEALYVKLYPDVGDAITTGIFTSAFHHWKKHGKHEGRSYLCEERR